MNELMAVDVKGDIEENIALNRGYSIDVDGYY
jgi:hypothetical protein